MYFPVGWPRYLSIPQENPLPPIYVVSNRDRSLFTVLTTNSLCIWFCKPSVQILSFRRSEKSVLEFGVNELAEWKPDSSMIAVTTSCGFMLFYKLDLDDNVGNHQCIYVQKDGRKSSPRRFVGDMLSGDGIPALKLTQLSWIQIQGGVSSMLCIRDELLLTTKNGRILRMRWDGTTNGKMSVNINTIPFSTDLQFSRASTVEDATIYATQIEYSPLLGGFSVVLSNGQAAFLTVTTLKFEPHIQGVWAQEVHNATCAAINHKYRLITFGCKNGEGIVYSIDEGTGSLQISHRLAVSSKDYPDASHVVGPVTHLKWTPDGCAVTMAWEKGGFAVWSVFGALLFCSLGGDYGLSEDAFKHHSLHIKSMEWGAEGYHLWVMASTEDQKSKPSQKSPEDLSDNQTSSNIAGEILQLQFIKSSLTVNPCMSNHQHLFLQGEDKLYFNTGEPTPTNPRPSHPKTGTHNKTRSVAQGPSFLTGSNQWMVVTIPQSYLGSNWPIRYTAVDRSGQCMAVAGKYGLAHYAVFNRKWKLFGNETQEKDMVVSGGLTWWRDFLCLACFNIVDQRDEVRLYPRSSKLDNAFCTSTKVPSQILLLNTFRDLIIVLCADCHIMMFSIDRKNTQPNPSVSITKLQEVPIASFIPHPASVTAITLTSLRTETASVKSKQPVAEAESILMNVAGRLLMFQRDRTALAIRQKEGKNKPLPFNNPVMVASAVENVWSTPRLNTEKKYLVEALWLGCGAHGMKVWLPLFPRDEVSTHGFMSKRIMLPFRVDIYPLAVLFEDAVILGAANDVMCYSSASEVNDILPFLTLERNSQIYLHLILRQLLRRNLGYHALEIARCCTDLPYFSHCLELLLHEVLEEEATSKEPIPDPLLPRVVAFIQEFPEYLSTVVHCARKTEVALWHYLFSTAGNPKDLYEECMLSGQLDVAASYLIIIQNLEKPSVSRQHATLLLDSALEQSDWELARDLVRFLKAIDPSDAESPPDMPPLTRANSANKYPGTNYRTPPHTPDIEDDQPSEFVFSTNPAVRARGPMSPNSPRGETADSKARARRESESLRRRRSPSGKEEASSADQFFIDVLLARHARKLLTAHRLKDVGCFAANMEGYHLVTWLTKEKLRAAKVDDFVSALRQLHLDFHWPLPLTPNLQYYGFSKPLGDPRSRSSSSSLLDQMTNGMAATNISSGMDSGYHGHYYAGARTPDTPSLPDGDILLQPKLTQQVSKDDVSLATTEISDDNSALGDTLSLDQSLSIETTELEQMSHELANKGPPQSEVQLRYLLHIMMEAGCLEWALLIAIVLRDAMAVVRTVNTASFTETQIEIVGRMREGMSYLVLWAETECLGYKPFFDALKTQIETLNRIAENNPPLSRLNTPRSRSNSSEKEEINGEVNNDETLMGNMEETLNGDEDENNESPTKEESGYECVVS